MNFPQRLQRVEDLQIGGLNTENLKNRKTSENVCERLEIVRLSNRESCLLVGELNSWT